MYVRSMEHTIIEFLQGDARSALSISKHVFGKNATKKMINPILYSMQKRNIIRIAQTPETQTGVWWELAKI